MTISKKTSAAPNQMFLILLHRNGIRRLNIFPTYPQYAPFCASTAPTVRRISTTSPSTDQFCT